MEILNFEFAAQAVAKQRALVGCVGSGDLEILVEPKEGDTLNIQVTT